MLPAVEVAAGELIQLPWSGASPAASNATHSRAERCVNRGVNILYRFEASFGIPGSLSTGLTTQQAQVLTV